MKVYFVLQQDKIVDGPGFLLVTSECVEYSAQGGLPVFHVVCTTFSTDSQRHICCPPHILVRVSHCWFNKLHLSNMS